MSKPLIATLVPCFALSLMQAPAGTVRDHCDLIVSNILRISLDAKPQIKAELYSLAKKLMLRCGPEKTMQVFLPCLIR